MTSMPELARKPALTGQSQQFAWSDMQGPCSRNAPVTQCYQPPCPKEPWTV